MKKIISLLLTLIMTALLLIFTASCSANGGDGRLGENKWKRAFDFSDVDNVTISFSEKDSGAPDSEVKTAFSLKITPNSIYRLIEEEGYKKEEYINDLGLIDYDGITPGEMLREVCGFGIDVFKEAYTGLSYDKESGIYSVMGKIKEDGAFDTVGDDKFEFRISGGKISEIKYTVNKETECTLTFSDYGKTDESMIPASEARVNFKRAKDGLFEAVSAECGIDAEKDEIIPEIFAALDELSFSKIIGSVTEIRGEKTSYIYTLKTATTNKKILGEQIFYAYVTAEINDGKMTSVKLGKDFTLDIGY